MNHTPAVAGVLLACLSVVAFLPGGLSRWTWPKLLVMVVAVAVTLFAPRSGRLPRWAWWVAGASVAVLAVSAVVSGELAGPWGRWPRYTGPLVAVPVGVGAVGVGAVRLGGWGPRGRARGVVPLPPRAGPAGRVGPATASGPGW